MKIIKFLKRSILVVPTSMVAVVMVWAVDVAADDGMMGTMPPAKKDASSDGTNHDHEQMMKDYEKLKKDHKNMAKSESAAAKEKRNKMKKMAPMKMEPMSPMEDDPMKSDAPMKDDAMEPMEGGHM